MHTKKHWLAATLMVMASVIVTPAFAEDDNVPEAELDTALRATAAAMQLETANGESMQTPASHLYLVDYNTGTVLAQKAGDQLMYPSSMTKMMTLYILFDGLKAGKIAPDSQFSVSEKAWRMEGSKMFVPLYGKVGMQDLIRGIAIQSGNDACVVAAEGIAGSETEFAKVMNAKAKELGMNLTRFMDSSGWPNANHVTTPHDLATLGVALIRDFPNYYHYFSEREYTYNGIRQFNRNLLLGNSSMKVDGIKTGHTEAAGYGITLSAQDPASNRRLVLVLNGLDSDAARAQEGERMLKWGFANFRNETLFRAGGEVMKANLWMGPKREMPVTVKEDVLASVPLNGKNPVRAVANYRTPLIAPMSKGIKVGTLTVTTADGKSRDYDLVTAEATEKLSGFSRLARKLGF